MSDMEWFPLYVNRFLNSRRLRRMSAASIGIYTLLLCESWEGGAIPDDDDELEFLGRCSASDARAVLKRCFKLTKGGWVNPELEGIRAEQTEKRDRLVEAGRKGGKARAANSASDAQAMLKPPSSIRREEKRIETTTAFEVEFSTFWEQYPKRVGKQTALKAWQARRREGIGVEDIMAGLTRYLKYKAITGEKHLNASTFLGPDERWAEDWYVAEVKTVVEDKRPVLDEKFKRPYEPVIESRPTRVEVEIPQHRGAV